MLTKVCTFCCYLFLLVAVFSPAPKSTGSMEPDKKEKNKLPVDDALPHPTVKKPPSSSGGTLGGANPPDAARQGTQPAATKQPPTTKDTTKDERKGKSNRQGGKTKKVGEH